jgi:hypothetical protein
MTIRRHRTRITSRLLAASLVAAISLVGCSGAATSSPGDAASLAPLDTGLASEPAATDETPVETTDPNEIPGFEGWQIINARSVQIGATEAGLAMTLTRRALWFQDSQGVLFYTDIEGNFRIVATVRTTRTSDSSQTPGGDGTVQLAGLMARAQTAQQNYVFIVVGSDANGLSVETTSTKDNQSTFAGPDWASGEADLQLCRVGSTFTLWKRVADSGGDWTLAKTYERPDLPDMLQVGANIYSDSPPDITARFDGLTIEPLDAGESCSTTG